MRIHRLFICLVGVVFIGGCAGGQRVREPLTGEAAAYRRDVETLASAKLEGRGAGTAGNEAAAAWIVEQFREIGLKPAFGGSYLQAFALADGTVVRNVGGYLPGAGAEEPGAALEDSLCPGLGRSKTLPGALCPGLGRSKTLPGALCPGLEVIIVGAHFDHLGYGGRDSFSYEHAIHPGADDNASGVAGLLLLARRYAQRVADGGRPANHPAILFVAFNAEEWKMAGSKYFVSHLNETRWGKSRIIAMLNMDMIGRLRDERLYVFGLDTSGEWAGRLARAMAGARSTLRVRTFGTANTASDQQPFAEAGVPVLMFFTGKHEDYHRVTDTAEKINSGGAVRVVEVVEKVIWDLGFRIAD
ncbi:MAG: M28 family peptidase [Phycisphaerales bacterium]